MLLSASLITTPSARAHEGAPTCQDRLSLCEAIIDNADVAIKSLTTVIAKQKNEIDLFNDRYDVMKRELAVQQAWYRNPSIVFPVAFVLGAVVMSQVSR